MTIGKLAALAAFGGAILTAEDSMTRARRVVSEAVAALGGDRFLAMQDRVERGRAYSFYREQLSALSVAAIYTRYLAPVPGKLSLRERQRFGKKQDYGYLYTENEGYDISFRGARPIAEDRFDRFRDSTLHNVFYVLRQRLGEPGMILESKGADVMDNRPVEIVDITDAANSTITVYFDSTTKLPLRQVYNHVNVKDKAQDEEQTVFTKYRDVGGGVQWPLTIQRNHNGERVFQMFSASVEIDRGLTDEVFSLPSGIKILKSH